jgi:hypothetical protein
LCGGWGVGGGGGGGGPPKETHILQYSSCSHPELNPCVNKTGA